MAKMLWTVRLDPTKTSLRDVLERYALKEGDLDAAYGVVPLAPEEGLFAVMVEADAVAGKGAGAEGPFSNPRVETFGPPPKASR